MTVIWGKLAPDEVRPLRRRLTLGLGRSVLLYNDAVAPGLGGLWFIRQAALALLGIQVAQDRASAGSRIEVANAIEALACLIGYQRRGWKRGDWRLRGPRKLARQAGGDWNWPYSGLSERGAYVSQPMRMSCVDALPAFGLVDASGARFNSFSINARGRQLTSAVFGGHFSLPNALDKWVRAEKLKFTNDLRAQLDPTSAVSENARKLMAEAIALSDKTGRLQDAMAWLRSIDADSRFGTKPHIHWDQKPQQVTPDHWQDLRAGAAMMQAREAAIGVVAAVETYMVDNRRLDLAKPMPTAIAASLADWRKRSQHFLDLDGHGPEAAAAEARTFCREAMAPDEAAIIMLVGRENHMLRATGRLVEPTPSWRAETAMRSVDAVETTADAGDALNDAPLRAESDVLPPFISVRMVHLRRLTLDLDGRLGDFIAAEGQAR